MQQIIFEIIALGWLACMFVDWALGLISLRQHKPFNCQKCMGFWVGIFYFSVKLIAFSSIPNLKLVIIYSLLTSLAATIEYSLIKRI